MRFISRRSRVIHIHHEFHLSLALQKKAEIPPSRDRKQWICVHIPRIESSSLPAQLLSLDAACNSTTKAQFSPSNFRSLMSRWFIELFSLDCYTYFIHTYPSGWSFRVKGPLRGEHRLLYALMAFSAQSASSSSSFSRSPRAFAPFLLSLLFSARTFGLLS